MYFAFPLGLLSVLPLAFLGASIGGSNGEQPGSPGENSTPLLAADVARRMLVLAKQLEFVAAAFPLVGFASQASSLEPESKRARFLEDLIQPFRAAVKQIQATELWDSATLAEQEFFEAAPLGLTMQQLVDGSWCGEAAMALAWGLQLVEEMPPFDHVVDRKVLFQLLSFEDVRQFAAHASLRPQQEIEQMRVLAQLWHWRSRMRELQDAGFRPIQELAELGVNSFDDLVRSTIAEAEKAGVAIQVLNDDLAARDKPYRDLDEREWQELTHIAEGRHHAFNWVSGLAPGNRWAETPLDT